MSGLLRLWGRPWVRFGVTPALALSLMAVAGSQKARSAIDHALRDPGSLLDARSPGGRDPGALFQTKLAYARRSPAGVHPRQRVLPVARARAPQTGGLPGLDDTPFGLPGGAPGPLGDSIPDLDGGGRPSSIGDTAPRFIGGGAVPAGATPSMPSPVSDATAPVPEPQSWGLLLIGVGTIGLLSRRRVRRGGVDARAKSRARR